MSNLNLLFCSSFSLRAPQTWKTHYFHMVCNSPSMYLKICSIFLQRTYILCVVLLFLPCILTFLLLLSVASLAYVSIIILTVLSFLTQVLGVRIFTVSNFLIVKHQYLLCILSELLLSPLFWELKWLSWRDSFHFFWARPMWDNSIMKICYRKYRCSTLGFLNLFLALWLKGSIKVHSLKGNILWQPSYF